MSIRRRSRSSRKASTDAARRATGMAGDLGRGRSSSLADETQGEQPPAKVVGIEVCERSLEVDDRDRVGRVAARTRVEVLGEIHDRLRRCRRIAPRAPRWPRSRSTRPAWSSSRRVCRRRHAIAQAAWTASLTPRCRHRSRTRPATASPGGWVATRIAKAALPSSPPAASRTGSTPRGTLRPGRRCWSWEVDAPRAPSVPCPKSASGRLDRFASIHLAAGTLTDIGLG